MKRILSILFAVLFVTIVLPTGALAENISIDSGGKFVSGGSIRTDQAVPYADLNTNNSIDALIKRSDLIIQCVVEYAPKASPMSLSKGIEEHSLQVSYLYKGSATGSTFWLDIDRTTFLPGTQVNLKIGDRVILFLNKTNSQGVYSPLSFAYESAKNNQNFSSLLSRVEQKCKKLPFESDGAGLVYGMESTQTRFVFASAPKVTKNRYILNTKGETLTIYSFATTKEVENCKAMIKGNTLVYGDRTVYVDTLFPATYYVNAERMEIALYCGSDEAINKKLTNKYEITGGYGGYFDDRSDIISADGSKIVSPPRYEVPPASVKALSKEADGIYIVKVKKTPVWGKGIEIKGAYELQVTKSLKGISRASFKLSEWPGVMRAGRSYVLFIRNVAAQTGGTNIILADGVYHSTFEVDDRGYVLPIREYGMKAPMKVAEFMRLCK